MSELIDRLAPQMTYRELTRLLATIGQLAELQNMVEHQYGYIDYLLGSDASMTTIGDNRELLRDIVSKRDSCVRRLADFIEYEISQRGAE